MSHSVFGVCWSLFSRVSKKRSNRLSTNAIGVKRICQCVTLAASLLAVASASASELNVQGSSATGGDAGTIRGRINGNMAFSVTGRFNDLVTIFDPWNNLVFYSDIGFLATADNATLAYYGFSRPRPAVKLQDNQTRCWLNVSNTPGWLNGGDVGVWNGSSWIDYDLIELRN